jgi:predicted permease
MTMQPMMPPAQPEYLLSIGRVSVSSEWIVTPAGTFPLAGTNVTSQDQTHTTTHTPAWAIIMVILFIWFFFLSLLFLFARETRVSGYVAMTLQSGEMMYTEQIQVFNDMQRADTLNRISYLQTLIGRARFAGNAGA